MAEERLQKQNKTLAILKLAVLAVIIAGVPAFIYLKYGSEVFSKDSAMDIIAYLRQHRSVSVLIILALQVIQVVVSLIPGQPVQFAASYMFGIPGALALSVAGAFIGSSIAFFLSKLLGQDSIRVLFGEERINSYSDKLNSAKSVFIVFLIYIIPGIPKDLAAYAAGVSEMRYTPFIIAATAGRTPAMMGSILFGYFFRVKNYTALIWVSVVVVLILVFCLVKRKKIYALMDDLAQKGAKKEASADEQN